MAVHLDTAAFEFTLQMLDTGNPGVCPRCLYLFAGSLWDASNKHAALSLMSNQHLFWSTCARMASAPGIDSNLSELRIKLSHNAAVCTRKSAHAHASSSPVDTVACLMDALCTCLLATLKLGVHSKQKNIFLSRNGMWPACIRDIMPDGIGPYARWACVVPTRKPLALLSRLTVVARRPVMYDLLISPTRDRIAAVLIRALTLWRVQDAAFPPGSPTSIALDPHMGTPTRTEGTSIMWEALGLLIVFQSGPDRRLNDFADFAAGYEQLLHDAIVGVASNPGIALENTRDFLACAASALCARGDLEIHPIVEEFRSRPHVNRFLQQGLSVGDTVFVYLRQRLDSRICSGPGCTNCGRDDLNGMRPLSVCSGCRIMRYCGPECQRRDWKSGSRDVPHRIICAAIGKFNAAGILVDGRTMDDFSSAYYDDSFLTDEEFGCLAKLALTDDTIPLDIQLGAIGLGLSQSRADIIRDLLLEGADDDIDVPSEDTDGSDTSTP